METQPQLLAALGHELRTPVSSIIGAASVLERAGADEATRERAVAVVLAEARRLSRMIDELLETGVEAATPLELSEIDVVEVVSRAIDSGTVAGRYATTTQVSLEAPSVLVASANADAVERIVTNLLDNATRHASSAVTVSASLQGERPEIRVSDDGPGVPPELVDSLFAPLVSGSEDGTGLGLWLSASLAERMGGELRYQADADAGAHFVLQLAAAR